MSNWEDARDTLAWALESYGDDFAIATSFQREGMAVIDIAAGISPRVRVFTLDTGRLPNESLAMIDTVRQRYGIETEIVRPDPAEVEPLVSLHGLDLFYRSVDLRRACCEVRKVRPLERKLETLRAWASGIRREQSETRVGTSKIEWDAKPVKINPIAEWTMSELLEYTRAHNVPEHPLYARGFTSIGCAPCTRPVAADEDPRAGRWWWEQDAHKECGIHFGPDGKARRS